MEYSEIVEDFRRRYEGTYVWIQIEEKDEEFLAKICEVVYNGTKIGVIYLDSEEFGNLTINMGSKGHSIKFKYPPVGVFQNGYDAFFFRRIPARQYRRGMCNDNSLIENIVSEYINGFEATLSESKIKHAFRHNTYSKLAALKLLGKPLYKSIALKNNFALCRSFLQDGDDHILFHWTNPVARISHEGHLTKVYQWAYKNLLENEWTNE